MYWFLLIVILIFVGIETTSRTETISGGKTTAQYNIIIYSKEKCPWCIRAKEELTRHGYSYKSIEVTTMDPNKLEKIVKATNRHTVPNIFIDGKNIGGYQELMKWLGEI